MYAVWASRSRLYYYSPDLYRTTENSDGDISRYYYEIQGYNLSTSSVDKTKTVTSYSSELLSAPTVNAMALNNNRLFYYSPNIYRTTENDEGEISRYYYEIQGYNLSTSSVDKTITVKSYSSETISAPVVNAMGVNDKYLFYYSQNAYETGENSSGTSTYYYYTIYGYNLSTGTVDKEIQVGNRCIHDEDDRTNECISTTYGNIPSINAMTVY